MVFSIWNQRMKLVITLLIAGWLAATAEARDLTFFFTADTHYGLGIDDFEAANKATIAAMNTLPGTPYPSAIGGIVGTPAGVLVAGDLTDAAHYWDFYGVYYTPQAYVDGFQTDYGLNGEARLHYPVFEGYGNHDFGDSFDIVRTAIADRNLHRDQPIHLSPNGLHYSWDWQGIHFVNLNVYPGGDTDARNSLDFLNSDLASEVGTSGRPVIVYHHYGFDSFSTQPRWWTGEERDAYADALLGYNVLGIFHGHLHTEMHYQWQGYDVFDGSAAKDGNFLVVHLGDDQMTVAARTADGWAWTFQKSVAVPEVSGIALLGATSIVVASFAAVRARKARRRQGAVMVPAG